MTPKEAFRARMALSRRIRATLGETFSDAAACAKWLRIEAEQIEREAVRKARPVERFDLSPDSPEAAF